MMYVGNISQVSGVITFREANGAASDTGTLGSTFPIGTIIFVMALNRAFSDVVPSLASGYTSLGTTSDSFGQSRFGYRVLTSTATTTGTWTDADYVCWWAANNPRNTWVVGTNNNSDALSTSAVYASATPDGTNDWVVSLNMNAGNFDWPALTAGSPTPTSRSALNLAAASCRIRIYDSGGVATSWPGQTLTSIGFTRWISNAVSVQAGA